MFYEHQNLSPLPETYFLAIEQKRSEELKRCNTVAEEIALKQVWAIRDMPTPRVTHYHRDNDWGGIGMFGLFGLL